MRTQRNNCSCHQMSFFEDRHRCHTRSEIHQDSCLFFHWREKEISQRQRRNQQSRDRDADTICQICQDGLLDSRLAHYQFIMSFNTWTGKIQRTLLFLSIQQIRRTCHFKNLQRGGWWFESHTLFIHLLQDFRCHFTFIAKRFCHHMINCSDRLSAYTDI